MKRDSMDQSDESNLNSSSAMSYSDRGGKYPKKKKKKKKEESRLNVFKK